MLSHKAALGGMPVTIIRQAVSRHIPVSSLAFTRIASMYNYNKSAPTPSSPQIVRFLHNTTLNQSPPVSYPLELTCRWKSAHPIYENIDTNIAKDLSPEDFDSEWFTCIYLMSKRTVLILEIHLHNLMLFFNLYRCLQIYLSSAQSSSWSMVENSYNSWTRVEWHSSTSYISYGKWAWWACYHAW